MASQQLLRVFVWLASALAPAETVAETVYEETLLGEASFPTSPETDLFGLGGMSAGSVGAGPPLPPLPTLVGNGAIASASSIGTFGNQVAGIEVSANALGGVAYQATGAFREFSITGPAPGQGFGAVLLIDQVGTYIVSASLYTLNVAFPPSPFLNIAEIRNGFVTAVRTVAVPPPFTLAAYDLTLDVDPLTQRAVARVHSAGSSWSTDAIAWSPADLVGPVRVTQIVGAVNAPIFGAGDVASARLAGFRIDEVLSVGVDIKPDSDTNTILPASRGTTPFAILSNERVDATSILPESIFLGGAAVAATPLGKYRCSPALVDEDELVDSICHVKTAEIAFGEDGFAGFEAVTSDGAPVRGGDYVRVLSP